ncbi:hypothetical protein ACFLTZ_01065, partial [Chloroflexota bacterium]
MKIKYSCVLLVLSVLFALMAPFPARAEEDALEWVKIDKPGLHGNVVVRNSEVNEITVGSRGTIYALDRENNVVYQSFSDGAGWEEITARLVGAGAVLPFSKIAIAPDATGTVAVVTNNNTEVYLSTDGGVTWNSTNVPGLVAGTIIQTITISKQYTEADESLREIAIGTADWGNNTTTGEVWVLQLGKFASSWQNQSLTVDPNKIGGEISAIAYSPSFQRDNTIVVIASTGSDVSAGPPLNYQNQTWLCLGKRDAAAGTTSWNTGVFNDYPVSIATAGDAVGAYISSSLALPSNYSGSNASSRQLFVSYNRSPSVNDDVYRLDDTTTHRLNANSGVAIDISSIA